jgi:hypothetical protein
VATMHSLSIVDLHILYINTESVAMEKQPCVLLLSLAYVPVNNGNALTSHFCIVVPDVAVNNRTYLGLHVKCPIFFPILNKSRFFDRLNNKSSQHQISRKSVKREPS